MVLKVLIAFWEAFYRKIFIHRVIFKGDAWDIILIALRNKDVHPHWSLEM